MSLPELKFSFLTKTDMGSAKTDILLGAQRCISRIRDKLLRPTLGRDNLSLGPAVGPNKLPRIYL